MKTQLISTGQVKITKNWREGNTHRWPRLVNTLLDSEFTDWLPIYCTVIEHPEGLIVIDTGIPVNANQPIYIPPQMRLIQRAAPFRITASEEIGPQLQLRGLKPNDVRWVILTHLHQDHEGGLQYFPNAEFLVSRTEWQAAQGLSGRMAGYLNWRWPKGFTPTLVDFDSGSYHNFASSQMVTRAGDIRLLPTPGHSLGHMSVVVEQSDHILFVAGDAAYTQDLLLRDCIDGVGPSPDDQHETHQQIIRLAAQTPMVFLPSHDPDSAARLEWHETISMEALSVSLSQRPLFD